MNIIIVKTNFLLLHVFMFVVCKVPDLTSFDVNLVIGQIIVQSLTEILLPCMETVNRSSHYTFSSGRPATTFLDDVQKQNVRRSKAIEMYNLFTFTYLSFNHFWLCCLNLIRRFFQKIRQELPSSLKI